MTPKIVLSIAAAAALVILAAAVAFYITFVKVPTDLAYKAAEGIRQAFQFTPQVRVNQTIVIEQSTPILEVATVSRDLFIDHSWEQSWMGSTKVIQIQGVFSVKAGFDLREPFKIDIERFPLRILASLPPPKILSVDMKDYKVLRDEDGWWNLVTAKDREDAVLEMRAEAIKKAAGSGLLKEAQSALEDRLREIAAANSSTITFKNEKPARESR